MLFAEISLGNDASRDFIVAQQLTMDELKRERDYFTTTIDSLHTNRVSYQDIDAILFHMATASTTTTAHILKSVSY